MTLEGLLEHSSAEYDRAVEACTALHSGLEVLTATLGLMNLIACTHVCSHVVHVQ